MAEQRVKKTAMISSTSVDLPEHRKEVMDACMRQDIFPKAMEHLPVRDADAVRMSLAMVDEADIYIGIYAWRYGHIPEGQDISITEMEFDRAVERGIPILVFLMHKDHPLTIDMVETNGDAQKKFTALKERASHGRGRREFRSPVELRAEVIHALADLRQREQSAGGEKPVPRSAGSPGLDPSAIHAAVASPDLDPEAFFRRLSPSSRRALNHAAGIRQYFTSVVLEKTELSKSESSERLPNWQAMPLSYVIAGLFENDSGPTRRLFLSKNIDVARFAMLVEQAAGPALPSRADYSPIILDKLPSPDPHTEQALQAARDIADRMGAPQIQSRHLLYGALSIKDDPLIKLLADVGVRQEDVPLSEPDPMTVPTSIAFVSADTSDGKDLLSFDADVNALSAARKTWPRRCRSGCSATGAAARASLWERWTSGSESSLT